VANMSYEKAILAMRCILLTGNSRRRPRPCLYVCVYKNSHLSLSRSISGEFDALKKGENGAETVVFTYSSFGATFGELSLMYGKPRAASIRATTDGQLWRYAYV
jgi:Cyclic nucleotide-binding domain